MNNQKKVWFAIILLIVVGAIVYLEAIKPHNGPTITAQQSAINGATASSTASSTGGSASGTPGSFAAPGGANVLQVSPAQFLASRASIVQQESTQFQAAPEITDPTGWINTQPFTLGSLIGKKVVLVDFWTYSCINCLRTIPYLNAWYAKYKDAGLVIVGVHTPEFQFEHDIANVQAAVKSLGIQYPVVLDSNMGTWNAYQNLYWPAEYLINVDGFVVHNSIGEGNYNETETAIQAALAQRDTALGIPTNTIPTGFITPSDTIAIDYNDVQSPETYFGAERNAYLADGPVMTNGTYTLTAPSGTAAIAAIQANSLYLGGTWDFEDQYAQNKTAGATVLYQYDSKNVYMVAASANANTPVTAKVLVDGKPITPAMAGSDVSAAGTVTFQANRLYNIIQGTNYGTHTLQFIIQTPGLQAYTFTFG